MFATTLKKRHKRIENKTKETYAFLAITFKTNKLKNKTTTNYIEMLFFFFFCRLFHNLVDLIFSMEFLLVDESPRQDGDVHDDGIEYLIILQKTKKKKIVFCS
jgi:hypothetical protein